MQTLYKILGYISIFIIILYSSNTAGICFNEYVTYFIVFLLFVFFIIKRCVPDAFLIYIIIYWFLLNLLISVILRTDFVFNKVAGYLIPVFISYFSVKVVGRSFLRKFEKWIFVLSCISMIFFIIQIVLPDVIHSMSQYFSRFIADFYAERYPGSWYNFFYTYQPSGIFMYTRNPGFMWEPGAFAMILIVGLLIDTFSRNKEFTIRKLIYFIAILSTFSTAGYLALLAYTMYYVLKVKNIFLKILAFLIYAVALFGISRLSFMLSKIEEFGKLDYSVNSILNGIEYDRVTTFKINMVRLFQLPIGYGVNPITDFYGNSFYGVNGLGVFFRTWGVVSVFILLRNFFLLIRNYLFDFKFIMFGIIALLIVFYSNPIERSPLFWSLLLFPMIYNTPIKHFEIIKKNK